MAAVNVAGILQGKPDMPTGTGWPAPCWRGLHAGLRRLGVFVGYLVPGENAMQILGPGLR